MIPLFHYSNPEKNIDLQSLGNIKYTGTRGQMCKLNLLKEMSVKWQQVGGLVGLSAAKLKYIDRIEGHNSKACMGRVITEWTQRDPKEVNSMEFRIVLVKHDMSVLTEFLLHTTNFTRVAFFLSPLPHTYLYYSCYRCCFRPPGEDC